MGNKKTHRTRVINNLGIVESRSEIETLLKKPGDAVVIRRGVLRSLVMRCPCGCGDEISANLDSRAAPAWRLYTTKKGLTLYPSIWRESGCRSHFIIWNNKIIWCDYSSLYEETEEDLSLQADVVRLLSAAGPMHYISISDELSQIPWSVLVACRKLVKQNKIKEQRDDEGVFYEDD